MTFMDELRDMQDRRLPELRGRKVAREMVASGEIEVIAPSRPGNEITVATPITRLLDQFARAGGTIEMSLAGIRFSYLGSVFGLAGSKLSDVTEGDIEKALQRVGFDGPTRAYSKFADTYLEECCRGLGIPRAIFEGDPKPRIRKDAKADVPVTISAVDGSLGITLPKSAVTYTLKPSGDAMGRSDLADQITAVKVGESHPDFRPMPFMAPVADVAVLGVKADQANQNACPKCGGETRELHLFSSVERFCETCQHSEPLSKTE